MSLLQGISFGFITGITTTLGVIIGMYSNTKSHKLVILSVLLLAISDGLADSYGMYTSLKKESKKDIYSALIKSTYLFISKVMISCILILPFILMTYSKKNIPAIISITMAVFGILLLSWIETLSKPLSKPFHYFITQSLLHVAILTFICVVTFLVSRFIDKI